jgi:hypothetical protein
MPKEKMSCVDAVRRMIKEWPSGERRSAGKIERSVDFILRSENSDEYPSGNTIMRRFREMKGNTVVSDMHGRDSRYTKVKIEPQANAIERK